MDQQREQTPVDVIQNVPLSERHTIADNAVEDITKETYECMPVESFGTFLIKKMGFDEKMGIGKKNQIVRPIEFVPRNHRQGLGADPMPSFLQKQKDGKNIPKELQNLVSKTGKNYNFIGDKLIDKNRQIEVNDRVKIVSGTHQDLKGFVTKIDKEKEEYTVELKNGQSVKVDKKVIQLLFEEDQEGENKRKKDNQSSSSSRSSSSSSRSASSQPKKHKKIKKDKKKKSKKDKKLKKLKWAEAHIRIRIISKKYQDGKFYNVKAIISDILDRRSFAVLTPSKNILEDLREKDIETVIPEIGKNIKILTGASRGLTGKLLERNKRKNEVVVQVNDTMETLVLSQDDVSEAVA